MDLHASPFLVKILLETVVWPLLAVATLFVLGLLLQWRHVHRWAVRAWSDLAIGAGFLIAYGLIYRGFSFPPAQVLDWLPLLVVAVWIAFAVGSNRAPWRLWLQGLLALAASGLLLAPILNQVGFVRGMMILLPAFALWFATWAYTGRNAWQEVSGGTPLLVAAVGHAVVAALGGSVLLGQLSGALAVCLGTWLILTRLPACRLAGRFGRGMAVLILGSLMLIGRYYAETPVAAVLLLVVTLGADAPVLALKRFRRLPVPGAVLSGLIAFVPAAASVWLTAATH